MNVELSGKAALVTGAARGIGAGIAKCLAEQNGGLYISADAEEELVEALEKTLGCPMLSERLAR